MAEDMLRSDGPLEFLQMLTSFEHGSTW